MTNPFLKYREQVARAIYQSKGYCYDEEEKMFQPFPWDDADDIVKQSCRDDATAALDALWNAMQAEGSVREALGQEVKRGQKQPCEWHAYTDSHPYAFMFPCIIIRTEPTDAQ